MENKLYPKLPKLNPVGEPWKRIEYNKGTFDLKWVAEPLKESIKEMEENKYYTPEISDIRVGYECEFHGMTTGGLCILDMQDSSKDRYIKEPNIEVWYPIKCGLGIWSNDRKPEDIYKLIENNQIRTSYLTKEQIESCGFTLKAKSIDYWFEINEDKRFSTDLQSFCGYKAYNVFLNYGFHDHRLHIKADFSGGEKYDEAETLYDGECKSINELRQILKQIHITPFYE